ncbi:MAG TPA: hypothetical protein VHU13_05405 [Solirubrobacteraceae bacterium]|nr:hypothetical protein [Solirubrobacteraceae bacterium]
MSYWRVGAALALAVLALASPPALAAHTPARRSPSRAPGGPPLSANGAGGGAVGEGEGGGGVPAAAGDQLVENGLSSPLCEGQLAGGLSAAQQSDCRTSSFVAAPAPTNNYGLDVHIDEGAFGLSKGGLLTVIQDVLIAPLWGALQWLVHALLALLEWCYALELLDGSTTSAAAGVLAHARARFTEPWLALVLSLASLLVLYHGLVRRRVAETLGGALSALAMMAAGLWVIADPGGTVGAIGRFADQASLGTLAATASGEGGWGRSAAATLGGGLRELYAGAIETPWCYLEFGNVRWCEDPAQLEPTLRTAALALASHQGASAERLHSGELVRGAATNGALFLAFAANGPARNSINDEDSLLHAICRSEEATKCHGPAAAEAEFRTDAGTMPRVLGLLAIAAGVLGMALLFGLLALRLLASAFLSLLLLLLAPFAVLAPAFGDGGRAAFTAWLTRLLGAVSSKLAFSFVLGALLTMQRMLAELASLGWWTQWLLLSAFWWSVFLKRHQAAAVLRGAGAVGGQHRARTGGSAPPAAMRAGLPGPVTGAGDRSRRPAGTRLERTLQTYGAIRHPARWTQARVTARLAPDRPRVDEANEGSRVPPAADARWRGSEQPVEGTSLEDQRRGRGGELAVTQQIDPLLLVSRRLAEQRPEPARQSGSVREPASTRELGSRRESGSARESARARKPTRPADARKAGTGQPEPARRSTQPTRDDREPAVERLPLSPISPRPPSVPDADRSPIMRDAFAVAERRKRQLGFAPLGDARIAGERAGDRRPADYGRPSGERTGRAGAKPATDGHTTDERPTDGKGGG